MEAFACFPAPLALKAVTTHRTPHSSPFWCRPLSSVRQPGTREDYGVRRGIAALAFPRSGETGPTPRSARRPLSMWGKISPPGERRGEGFFSLSPRAHFCPHLAGLPLRMEAFACFPAPLALKAVTTHRTPQSSPFWCRPRFSVRQPGRREDYGVRRGIAALGRQRSGETGPTPRSARRPLRMWAKMSRKRRGGAGVRSRGSPGPHLNGYVPRMNAERSPARPHAERGDEEEPAVPPAGCDPWLLKGGSGARWDSP